MRALLPRPRRPRQGAEDQARFRLARVFARRRPRGAAPAPPTLRAKYVVARFCPAFAKRPASSPSLMGRGSSLACRPSLWRISSARSPFGLSFSSPAIRSIARAMSPADRRESLPLRRREAPAAGEATGKDAEALRAEPRCALPAESERSSSSEAPRIASSTRAENDEVRSLRRLRSVMVMAAR
jgi:hypothetical protein